jgi:hypothetical protein
MIYIQTAKYMAKDLAIWNVQYEYMRTWARLCERVLTGKKDLGCGVGLGFLYFGWNSGV